MLTAPPRRDQATFLYSEPDWDMALDRADIAFLGIPFGSGYSFAEQVPGQSRAPAAMRAATDRILRSIEARSAGRHGLVRKGRVVGLGRAADREPAGGGPSGGVFRPGVTPLARPLHSA